MPHFLYKMFARFIFMCTFATATEKNTLRQQAKLRLGRIQARPVRLSVRTQDFHS